MPIARRRAARRPAMPHRSVSSRRPSASRCDGSSSRQRTPPAAASFFARRLATLASVFVGAIPTETGIPVHCSTVRRSSRACASSRASKPAESEERFIDRVDLKVRREAGEHPHHARAHVAIERIIARTHHDARFVETRRGRDARARPFRRRAPWLRSSARLHNRRCSTAPQQAFRAGAVQTRARTKRRNYCSRQGRSARPRQSMRIDFVITPHTSKTVSSFKRMSPKAGFSACNQVRAPFLR